MRTASSLLAGALLLATSSAVAAQVEHASAEIQADRERASSHVPQHSDGLWNSHPAGARAPMNGTRQSPSPAQGTVTGLVTDSESGAPLQTVQIYIAGSDQGTLTQANGRYLLPGVPDGTHTLTAERIGYETETAEVTVQSGATVVQDFVLAQSALAMDEIVVTGVPGGTRRRAVGNAVGELDAGGVTEVTPVSDVQQILRGRATSVNMMGSGMVGAAPRMRVRGASTFSLTGNPLVYVDGVRINNDETTGYTFGNNAGVRGALSTLDPEQIEEIEILKGPAAATLYGTEASRGVINIITRQGREGSATVNVMVRQGVNYVADPENRLAYENFWTDPETGDIQSLNMIRHLDQQGRNPFIYGHIQSYSANVSGSSSDTRYFFSGTYSDETGVYDWNWMKNLNLRANVSSQVFENLGVTANLGYTNSKDRLPTDGFASIVEGIQFGNPRNLPSNRCRLNPGFGCDVFNGFNTFDVPARDHTLENQQFLDRFTGSLNFTYDPFDWLSARLITGVDYTGELNVAFREFQTNDTTVASLGSIGRKGFRTEGRWSRFRTTTDLSSTAELELTPTLTSATSAGIQYYTRSFSFLQSHGEQFAGPGLKTISSTAIISTPNNNFVTNNTLGLYVQETLGWQDRLFLTGAVRVDNNSAFGDEIDLVTYPKASLSWVMDEEGWFDGVAPSWLNTLRLRAAWGESGEQPPAFSALRTWSPVTGPQNSTGVTPNTVGNPDLSAEVGRETEVGFDSELLGNRLDLEFTYYHKLTRDAILQRDLSPSGGFTGQQFVNAGKIENEGVETSLDARILARPEFSWDLGFNFSYNRAEIQQLSGQPGDTTIVFNSWSSMEHRVGHAPYSWFGVDVVSAEVDSEGNVLSAMCSDGAGGTTPCFDQDFNAIAPRVDLGRAIAPVEMSVTTDFTFGRGLRLHALFTSEQGHKRFDNTLRQRCRLYRVCRANHHPEEWDPEMRATVVSSDQIIDSWVNDVSFVRLKELSLTYSLPPGLIQSFGASRASWQIAGRNLLTFTDWTDSDPEVMFSSGGRAFMQQNNLPLPQQIVTTIRVSF